MDEIKNRKKDHINLAVAGDVEYEHPAGFGQYRFIHNALPEVNIDEVNTETTFLGRTFSFPLFISSMTGGYSEAGAVNAIIAEFCQAENIPFGVGSQRIMLEDAEAVSSFSVVREKAPTAFIASNIGGAQLIGGLKKEKMNLLIDSIEADAVIVHLNPLQELMQQEGDRNFKGISGGIRRLVNDSPVPVIVKETGAGISAKVAQRLIHIGVRFMDVAGAGGTSWSKVENLRNADSQPVFNEWGIPTVECIRQLAELKATHDLKIIASGGIRSGVDIAKSLCLGADFSASARPVIQAILEDGYEGLEKRFNKWKHQVKVIMTLLGCEKVTQLRSEHLQQIPLLS